MKLYTYSIVRSFVFCCKFVLLQPIKPSRVKGFT